MHKKFEEMSATSKVWVYQANRELTSNEISEIVESLNEFLAGWKRHGDSLHSAFAIKYNQFITLAVDENIVGISGCSIDESINFFKKFEKKFNVDFTNKLNISFRNGTTINVVPLPTFQEFAKLGKINSETIVFNNMVATIAEFEQNWEVPARNSWHKRFFS